jgi:hypothetical protein
MTSPLLTADDQKRIALRHILAAWDDALGQGVEPEMLASSALFAAFTDMVDLHGAEAVAAFAATLPARIRAGEFSPGQDPFAP